MQSFSVYTAIVEKLWIEFFAINALFSLPRKRTRFFLLKLIVAVLAMQASLFLFYFLERAVGQLFPKNLFDFFHRLILYSVIVFDLLLTLFWLYPQVSRSNLLLQIASVTAMQRFTCNAYELLLLASGYNPRKTISFLPASGPVVNYILMALTESVLCLSVYFLFHCYKTHDDYKPQRNFLVIVFGVTISTMVLCNINYIYFNESRMLIVTGYLYGCICSLFALALRSEFYNRTEAELTSAVLQKMLAEKQSQYELSKQTIDLLNIKYHDLKHILHCNEGALNRERSEIRKLLEQYESFVHVENETLNVILTEKNLQCVAKGINLTYMIEAVDLSFMREIDLYTFFGNALDNAIEYLSGLDNPEKKFIRLSIHKSGPLVLIRMENYCEEKLSFHDGVPRTTKSGSGHHGYGTKSIRYMIKKYGGDVTFKTENRLFVLSAYLPANDLKASA